jgi:hypothetical protein
MLSITNFCLLRDLCCILVYSVLLLLLWIVHEYGFSGLVSSFSLLLICPMMLDRFYLAQTNAIVRHYVQKIMSG